MPLSKQRNRERMKVVRLLERASREPRERCIRLPFRIFRRDNFTCQYCGMTPQDGVKLELDHINPRKLGGGDEDSNLVTACFNCNRSKSDVPLFQPSVIQPKTVIIEGKQYIVPEIDADGNVIYDE